MAAWTIVSVAFEVYANAFASYGSTYGALGTTIAGLVWLWLTNLTLLMGVELDAALEVRRAPSGSGREGPREAELSPVPRGSKAGAEAK